MQQLREQIEKTDLDHISVCICTYKRPHLLNILLNKLQTQITEGLFTYSVTVVDNDHTQSARDVVVSCKENSIIDIDYYCEPEQNISLARNNTIQNAKGNFIALIDDDEFPANNNWLLDLYKTFNMYKADGILGPVIPNFPVRPPQWIVKAKMFYKPIKKIKTGSVLKLKNTRTSNCLLGKYIFDNEENKFNPYYGRTGGEDIDFFRRMIENGYVFVWCDKAMVCEIITPERLKKKYFLKSALLRGMVVSKNPSVKSVIKSYIAFLIYTAILPLYALFSQVLFMKILIKNCDHIGNLLGILGMHYIKERPEFINNKKLKFSVKNSL